MEMSFLKVKGILSEILYHVGCSVDTLWIPEQYVLLTTESLGNAILEL